MEMFITVVLSVYIGVALYEFYTAFLYGDSTQECFFRALVWPVEVFFVFKDIIWKYRNWK